jgi:hypothetical protein
MSKRAYKCKDCGSGIKARLSKMPCPACESHYDADISVAAAEFLEKLKYRDPDGSIEPVLEHASRTLRQCALNSRHVARLLGAVKRP